MHIRQQPRGPMGGSALFLDLQPLILYTRPDTMITYVL
jgi:hypothetical protein